ACGLPLTSHSREDRRHRSVVRLPLCVAADGGYANALLIELGRLPRDTPRGHAADIAPVRAGDRKRKELPVEEYRVDGRDVVQVRAARVRIVVQEDVTWIDVVTEALEDGPDRPRDREDVHRVIRRRLGDELAE